MAKVTRRCDWRIRDLVEGDRPATLYLVVPPSDISRTKPLVRLILNQIGRRLTEDLHAKGRRHRLLLMLDEFPAARPARFLRDESCRVSPFDHPTGRFFSMGRTGRSGVVLNKDGSFQRTAKFRGPDLDSAVPAERVGVAGRLNNAFRRLGSGWAVFVEAQRHAAGRYPQSQLPDVASALVDLERREEFEEEGAHYDDKATRLENRVGEPAANPYLYMASQILSGLDGVDRALDPGPADTPYETEASLLPKSLREAVFALEQDPFFRGAMGVELVDYYVHIKNAEIERFQADVTEWEQREYFEMF